MQIGFKPWRPLQAVYDHVEVEAVIDVGHTVMRTFLDGLQGLHSGRTYVRHGRSHQASAPGEYPANDSGALRASLGTTRGFNSVTVGATVEHARYLMGTSRIARRKMFDDAMKESAWHALKFAGRFAHFRPE